MAASFDTAIAEAVGRSMGNDCLMANRKAYSGIYGPGANIHRTPYSGRNFEYYSEDPFISGKTCAAETAGIQSKGVYVYNKHFAFNDQETGRDGICVWTNEQAAREIYPSSSRPWSTVIHCLPLVTPGRSPAAAALRRAT